MLEKRIFTGGMDSDSDDRTVVQGDYRFAVNIKNSGNQDKGSGTVESVNGDVLVSTSLPSGQNKVIGSCLDEINNKVYFFLWNDNAKHSIFEYDIVLNYISLLLQNKVLNFNQDYLIVSPFVLDGLLYWTDGYEHPGCINIQRAKNGLYPTNLTRRFINNIVPQPVMPPTIEFDSDTSKRINNIRGNVFQFRTQFVDWDNKRSAFSSISKVIPPPFEDSYNIINNSFSSFQNNLLKVTVETGDEAIRQIRIIVREGNTGDFYLVDVINKDDPSTWINGLAPIDNSTYVYQFYNDKTVSILDQTEANKPYDFVPLKAKEQSLLDGQRLGYFNITEGFANVDMGSSFASVISLNDQLFGVEQGRIHGSGDRVSNIDQSSGDTPNYTKNTEEVTIVYNGSTYSSMNGQKISDLDVYISGTFYENDIIDIQFSFDIKYITITPSSPTPDPNSNFNSNTKTIRYTHIVTNIEESSPGLGLLISNIINKLNFDTTLLPSILSLSVFGAASIISCQAIPFTSSSTGFIIKTIVNTVNAAPFSSNYIKGIYTKVNVNAVSSKLKSSPSFKSGATHPIGIVYYDYAGRFGKVQSNQNLVPYAPFPTEDSSIGRNFIRINIDHTPPEYATHYSIVYAGNNQTSRFLWTRVSTVSQIADNKYTINLSPILEYNQAYGEVPTLSYTYTKGDKIRAVWFNPSTTSAEVFTDFIEYNIISFDTSTNIATVTTDENSQMKITIGNMVEIYTPKKVSDAQLFFETGNVFQITNGYHKGTLQNQTSTLPAIVDIYEGDVWIRPRKYNFLPTFTDDINYLCEDFSLSDFYSSQVWSKGRANNIDKLFKQIHRQVTSYWSELYIPETQINGLSNFYPESTRTYNHAYGPIQKCFSQGERLVIFQQRKVGFALINKDILFNASGGVVGDVSSENTVLSKMNYYGLEYGIGTNPESFAQYGANMYFTDAPKGAVLRLNYNSGIERIDSNHDAVQGSYLMASTFNSLFEQRTSSGKIFFIHGGYVPETKEYIVSFEPIYKELNLTQNNSTVPEGIRPNVSSSFSVDRVIKEIDGITLSFSESKNRWTTSYSYDSECLQQIPSTYISFWNGRLYKHGEGEPCVFRGVFTPASITVVFNENPTLIKFYKNIIEESNDIWECPEITNHFSQKSSLINEDFETFEGVHKAALLQDENTPNIDDPLINGDELRCHSLVVKFSADNTNPQKLFAVALRYELSEMNN